MRARTVGSEKRTSKRVHRLVVSVAFFLVGILWGTLQLPPAELLRDALRTVVVETQDVTQPYGRFREAAPDSDDVELSAEQRRRIAELESLGYLSGTTPASGKSGVTIYDPQLTADGLNLLTDGHRPEARLVDMKGRVLHQWHFPFERAFPDAATTSPVGHGAEISREYWRRVALLDDGGLLAIYEGQGLVRLTRESELVWAYPARAHHDLEVLGDGTIYVLTREAEIVPAFNPEEPILHDYVSILAPDGSEIRRVPILEALARSPYAALLTLAADAGDIFHTNSLEVLDGRLADRLPAFAAGNVLVSLREIDTIAVIDMQKEVVAWAMTGLWHAQHDPTVLDSGNILVFDNKGDAGRSRVLEVDPVTQETSWVYSGIEHDIYSATCGASQRLPNGNTLITETDNGRAIEVTSDQTTVWEYYAPYRAGPSSDLIASLFEVVRLDPDTPLDWLDSPFYPTPGE